MSQDFHLSEYVRVRHGKIIGKKKQKKKKVWCQVPSHEVCMSGTPIKIEKKKKKKKDFHVSEKKEKKRKKKFHPQNLALLTYSFGVGLIRMCF